MCSFHYSLNFSGASINNDFDVVSRIYDNLNICSEKSNEGKESLFNKTLERKCPMPMSQPQANVLAKRTFLLAVAAMGFAQTVLFAIFALLGHEVGLVEVQIGSIISSSSLTLFLVSPLWGRASDVWGRRKILLIGLFGY
jgi:hypothetical protein